MDLCLCSKDLHQWLVVNYRETGNYFLDNHRLMKFCGLMKFCDQTAVEKVKSFKFLSVHITDHLKWSTHTDSVVKKAQKRIFNLRRLKKFVLAPKSLTNLQMHN